MSFEITGKLYKKFDTVQVSDRFKKREFVLETENGAYSELIKFQIVQDRCSVIDAFNEGQEVKVYFDLKGRAWTGRDGTTSYFTNLQSWKVEGAAQAQAAAQTPPPASAGDDFPSAADAPPSFGGNDDLPF
ncbi:MAG: DUF3127 domain-containing protein [Saprospiraceae bacterium]